MRMTIKFYLERATKVEYNADTEAIRKYADITCTIRPNDSCARGKIKCLGMH